jgi:hypothetical protein
MRANKLESAMPPLGVVEARCPKVVSPDLARLLILGVNLFAR